MPFAVKVGLGLALLAVVLLSFSIGWYPFTPELPLQTVWAQITDPASIAGTPEQVALFNIRLPRVLTVLLAGAGLAVSGAAYQGMFKNPLVSPDILGASAGASLGAVTALLFAAPNWVVQLAAFTGGMLAVALTVGLGRMVRYDAVLSLVLGGMLVSTLFQSGVSLVKYLADGDDRLPVITFWLMGSFSSVDKRDFSVIARPMLAGFALLLLQGWKLNVLSFGDEEARSLGINTRRTRLIVIFCSTLLVPCSVAIAGVRWPAPFFRRRRARVLARVRAEQRLQPGAPGVLGGGDARGSAPDGGEALLCAVRQAQVVADNDYRAGVAPPRSAGEKGHGARKAAAPQELQAAELVDDKEALRGGAAPVGCQGLCGALAFAARGVFRGSVSLILCWRFRSVALSDVRCGSGILHEPVEMSVDLGDGLVGDMPAQPRARRLRAGVKGACGSRQVGAARKRDAPAFRQQHVVDAALLEQPVLVPPPYAGRQHAVHTHAACLQALDGAREPAGFANLYVAGEYEQHGAPPCRVRP